MPPRVPKYYYQLPLGPSYDTELKDPGFCRLYRS